MKKKFLSGLVSLLALATMASCGGGESSVTSSTTTTSSSVAETSSVASSDAGTSSASDAITAVSITNKDALKAEWHAGDQTRKIELSVTPTSNITALINQGKLTVTSSDATVVSASGLTLSAVGAGTATITVAAGTITDTVEITVAGTLTAIEKYQTVHAGTEEDPLDNEDAVKVAKAVGSDSSKATDKYFVQGVVKSFRDAPSSYGNVSFYLTPAAGKTEQFLAYRVKKGEAGADVTNDDIWVGGTATVYCNFYAYNGNVYENSTGYLVSCTGEKVVVETHEVNVAGAIAACKALDENTSSTDIYVITGYVANNDGTSLYLVDTDVTESQTIDPATMFQVYSFKKTLTDAAEQAKCTPGAKVKVTCTIKYYKSTTSTNYAYETSTISTIVVLEAGETEKAATEATVAEALTACNALEDGGKSTDKYAVTGYIVEITEAYTTKYGNMSLKIADAAGETDTTKILSIYRGEPADGVDVTKLEVGAQIKVTGILNKYVKDGSTSLQMAAGGSITLVKEKEIVAATAISLPETATIPLGETLKLDITTTPANATLDSVTWVSSVTTVATVADGVVTPVSAGTTVITATAGTLTASCTVTVEAALDYGTEADPLSVTELNTLGATIVPEANNWSTKVVYVSAKISSVPTYNSSYKSYTFNFVDPADSTKTGTFYSGDFDTDVTKIAQNDTVVLAGYLKNQNGTFQISFNSKATDDFKTPKVLSRIAGTSAITVDATSSANVTVSEVAATAANDTTVSFTAVAKEGYTLNKVLVNNKEITAAEGIYSFVVEGDTTISFETTSASVTETHLASYNFASNGSTSKLDAAGIKTLFETCADTTTEGLTNIVTNISSQSNVYAGYDGNEAKGMKFGTSSAVGKFTVTTSVAVSKVVVTAVGWKATDKLSVGGKEQTPGTESVELTYNLDEAATSIEFIFNKRGYITSIDFFSVTAA